MVKSSLRNKLIFKLDSLSDDLILSLRSKLTSQILKFFSMNPELQSQTGASYLPLRKELAPNNKDFPKKFFDCLAFPVFVEGNMLFGFSEGEPTGSLWLKPPYQLVTPRWIFVPGVGFDLKGARLGRGKGMYDHYLEGKDILKIGLSWTEQIVEKIPVEKHDSHMDFIITEEFCWNVVRQEKF